MIQSFVDVAMGQGSGTISVWYRVRVGLVRALALAALAFGAGGAWATTSINHQFSPAVINQGDTSVYTITFTNDSTTPLTDAKATIFLDNTLAAPDVAGGNISIASGTVVSNTCGFTGVTAATADKKIILTGGTIGAGTVSTPYQCTFALDVTATTVGTYLAVFPATTSPSATVTGYEATENTVVVQNTTSASISLQVNALSPPTGSKAYSPSPAIAGDPTTLTITLSNPNAGSTMPLTSFVDALPTGMKVASTPGASVNCTGTGAVNGIFAPVADDNTLTLTGGTIGQSGSCVLSVKVIVPTLTPGNTTQIYANSLAGGAIGNTRGLSSPAFSQNLTVNTPIAVSKSFSPTTIPAGQPSLMTITITNNSTTNTLPITSFADDLTTSSLKVLNTASSPVAAIANPTVVCDGAGADNGTLTYTPDVLGTSLTLANAIAGPKSGANGKCVISAYVTASVDGTRTNSVAAGAVVNPIGHQSPAASAGLSVNGQLTVDKTVSVNSVAPGQWTQFTVTIRNYAGGDITNVSFTDSLPANGGNQMVLDGVNPVSNVGCTGGAWTGLDGAAALSWSGGTIAAGVGASPGLCTIVFKARLPVTATTGLVFSNQIPIGGTSGTCSGANCSVGNGNPVNNPAASPAVNVTTADAIAMTKAFSPNSIAQGGQSTLTLRIRNRTLGALTAVNLTDTFPAGLTLAANPAATSSGCGGTLTAYPGDNKVTLAGGSIAARPDSSIQTDCTITVRVTSANTGSYVNTINPGDLSTSGGTIPSAVAATLAVTTGITSSKAFSPTSVTPGGKSRVIITVNNTSNGDLTNVVINDSTFVGLTVANPANAATSCAGSPTLVANPGATSAQLQGATLNAGASCTLSFDVQTSGAAPWSNTVPVGGITSAEGVSNTVAATASLTSIAGAININKSFSPVIVTGGVPSTLTITLTNPTASVLHGVGFTDVFPSGIQVYSVPDVTSTCTGGTVTAVSGVGQMSLAGATMAANSTCTITLQVTSVKFLNLTNVIGAGAVVSTEGYTNPSAVSATLTTLQGLGVMKAFSPAYVVPNAVSRLKMQLVSTYDPNAPTPLTLTGVSYTDTLPAGILVAPAPNPTTTCVGTGAGGYANITANAGTGLVTVSSATIAPGSNCTIEVDVVAPAALGTYTNLIPANAITTDQGPTNSNPATAKLYVVAQPTLAKAFSPITVSVGAPSTLTVTINNGAGVALTGVSLADNLPSGVTIAATPAASTTCSNASVTANPGASVLAISGATVPAGGSCTFQAAVSSLTAGVYNNSIAAGALTSVQGLSNPGPADATLTVRSTPTISKAFSPVSISVGGTSILTITLGNSNADAITLSSALVDALPGNVVVHGTPAIGGTCVNVSGTPNALGAVTATAGSSAVTFESGASIPNGGCTISVNVTSAVAGTYTNVIAASQLDTSAGKNQDPAFASLAVGAGALVPPTVSKAFAPGTIGINGTSTLTITLGNANASDLTLSADLVDTLPANVVVAATPAIGGTCTTGSVTATAGAGTITYANTATIPAAGCTITVNVTSATPGSYTNTIAAGTVQTNGGNNAQPATAGLVVASPIPPTVGKSFNPNTINPGGISRLTITLGNSNAGSITLNSLLTDTLPAGVAVAATPNVGGSCVGASIAASGGGSTVTYASGASVPAGGCTISVDVTASSSVGSPFTNTIAAGALVTSAGNNGAPATDKLFVNPPQPPSVSKSFSPSSMGVGGTSTLTISLGNGNLAGTVLTADLTDALPANLVVAPVPNIRVGGGCTLAKVLAAAGATSVVYQTGGAIPAGGCSLAVDVTSSVALTSYSNTIASGALQTGIGNNAVGSTATLAVLPLPTLSKSFAPASILAGASSTLTLTLGNTTGAALTLTQALTDTFPASTLGTLAGTLVLANPATVGGTCINTNPGKVTATAGAGGVTYASGATIPSGGCTITVPVTSVLGGVFPNNIPAGSLKTAIGNNPTAATSTLTVLAPPSVVKAFSPSQIQPAGTSTLTITLGNRNGSALTLNAILTDTLPANLLVAPTPAVGGTCPGSKTAVAGGNSVNYASGASIPVGDCTITVAVTSNVLNSYVNTIPVGALQTTGGNNPTPATATLAVTFAAVTGVPTLSEWGLIMLSSLVLLLGLARSRRQHGAMR